MKKLFLCLLLVYMISENSFSQNKHYLDSLQRLLLLTKEDTSKVKIIIKLAHVLRGSDPEKALQDLQFALKLSRKNGYKRGIGETYHIIGDIYLFRGEYALAIDYLTKALEIRKELGDKFGLVPSYCDVGVYYYLQGNYPETLKNYYAALKIAEEIGYKDGMPPLYTNIGALYFQLGNYSEALKNFNNCLRLSKELKNQNSYTALCTMGGAHVNIGAINHIQSKLSDALQNYSEALKLFKSAGYKKGLVDVYNDMGTVYKDAGNYDEELKSHLTAIKISEEIHNKDGIANAYSEIGASYIKQKKYSEAAKYLDKALRLSTEINSLELMKNSYRYLTTLDSLTGRYKQALGHYQSFISVRDSLVNVERAKKTVQMQMQYEFDKKESEAKAEQVRKDLLAQKELQRQTWLRNGFIGGFLIVLLFASVFFTQRNRIRKEKKRSDELLLNILPSEVAEELKEKGRADAKHFDQVTVMFTDFKGFTMISEQLTPTELVEEIDTCFKAFDHIITKFNIEKIKTIGDSYMCAGGLPMETKTHSSDVLMAALEIQNYMLEHNRQRQLDNKPVFEIRVGIHTGPVVAGIVGVKKFQYDIWGDTVNLASRMESSGEAGRINISGTTYELAKDQFLCTYRGKIQAKNKGEVDMYFLDGKM